MSKSQIMVDEGSDKRVATHTITEDSVEKHLERIAVGGGVVTLPSNDQVSEVSATGDYPTTAVDVSGAGSIIVRSSFSDANVGATCRFLFYDSADFLIGVSGEQNFTAGDDQENSRYIGSTIFIDNSVIGAASIKIRVTDVPSSGNVSFSIATL